MMTNKNFSRTTVLNAPVDALWQIISRAGGVNEWLPFISSCRLEGAGSILRRYCETVDGKKLSETIDRIDEKNYSFEYSIYAQNMMPLQNYKGKFQLQAAAAGKTNITWSASFDIAEEDFPAVEENLKGLYQMGFDGLEKLALQEAA